MFFNRTLKYIYLVDTIVSLQHNELSSRRDSYTSQVHSHCYPVKALLDSAKNRFGISGAIC